MYEYDKLIMDYEQKLFKIQSKCKHRKLTEWIDENNFTSVKSDYQVKKCLNCNKEIERKKNYFFRELMRR